MVGMVDERREGNRELARIHHRLVVLTGEEDAEVIAGRQRHFRRRKALIAIELILWREDGVEDDFRRSRQDEVVFVVDIREKALERCRREAVPEIGKGDFDLRLHRDSPAQTLAHFGRSWMPSLDEVPAFAGKAAFLSSRLLTEKS